jgi:GTPase SAR1 family protein
MSSARSLPAVVAPPAMSRAQLVALSPPLRLATISNIFLFTTKVREVLTQLAYVRHEQATSGLHSNMLLYGPESSGKTALIRHFLGQHPPVPDEKIDRQPVIMSAAPTRPDAVRVAEAILADGGWPQGTTGKSAVLAKVQIRIFLSRTQTRVLILDHADRWIHSSGSFSAEGADLIEDLLDTSPCPIVLVGEGSLLDAMRKCKKLTGRFPLKMELPYTPLGKEWNETCTLLDQKLPFEKTEICSGDMPARLHWAAEDGSTPELLRLAQTASKQAIYGNKSLELTRKHFRKAYELGAKKGLNPFDEIPLTSLAAALHAVPATSAYEAAFRTNNRTRSE